MAIAKHTTKRCLPDEWKKFRAMVSDGMLFEVIDWIDSGRSTLRPEGKKSSAFQTALLTPNHSMAKILWERAWQDDFEVERAITYLFLHQSSIEVMRYVIEAGCPVAHLSGDDLCQTHDLDLIRSGMKRGVSLLEPEGWATTFRRVGSRPMIRLYLEERDRIPELHNDAVRAMCRCISESRLRSVGLLLWAGVDPLGKAPRWNADNEPVEKWDGFPALHLAGAEKGREMLKLLKLKPSVPQWFELLEATITGNRELLYDVLALVENPDEILLTNRCESEKLLRGLLTRLCWIGDWGHQRQKVIVQFCLHLLELGVSLRWENRQQIAQLRREFYGAENYDGILQVMRIAAETADEKSRADLVELVRTPKCRELVIQHAPEILTGLGLKGPDYYDA